MYTLKGKTMCYAIDECGRVASVYNRLTCHEYIYEPEALWKLIYQEGERVEIPIWARGQRFTASLSEDVLTLTYPTLTGDGRIIDATLGLTFRMSSSGLTVSAFLENRDSDARIMELQLTPLSGARSLSGNPALDALTWPVDLGSSVQNPAYSDLSVSAGFRKYERHDQFHTDMDALYPGRASMQWYDWYNEAEGLYLGSHDATHRTVCLHIERDVKKNILRMGFIRYPMLAQGENWTSEPIVVAPQTGDWHAGARMYRAWMEAEGGFAAPEQPEWVKSFRGWLRVILKQHHMELNWDFGQIPELYDEVAAAGMDTLYLLGWEKGGFARMWPDYVVDERLGGEAKLREGVEYVHAHGGKVLLFLSYALVDHESEFYRKEGGDKATIRSIWNQEIPFAETYCGEGTYRKIGNPPMPMYLSCPGSPIWQEKMEASARYCLDLGVDGVLYDIGGMTPYFCYAKDHTHEKPSHSHENKDKNFQKLRQCVKSYGADKAILMEHNVDIFGQHMDIAQGNGTHPGNGRMIELYRYTFPELIMTNRECGEDENRYRTLANYSFVYGLRFDMTIFRCCGQLSDIPNYAAYLKELTGLYSQFSDYILKGRFVDTDGFSWDNRAICVKGWRNGEGKLALTLWNPTEETQSVCVCGAEGQLCLTLAPESVAAAKLANE